MLSHELALAATLCLSASDGGVDAVKDLFNEIEAGLASKALTTEKLNDCNDEFSSFEVSRDAKGAVRRLVHDFGGEDSSQRAASYYDDTGRLRFLFVKVGAVPSAWVEARWWFDERGKIIKTRRKVGGEGPQYYAHEPGPYLVKDPVTFLKQLQRCP